MAGRATFAPAIPHCSAPQPPPCLPAPLTCSEEVLKQLAEQMQGLAIPEARKYYRQALAEGRRAATCSGRCPESRLGDARLMLRPCHRPVGGVWPSSC